LETLTAVRFPWPILRKSVIAISGLKPTLASVLKCPDAIPVIALIRIPQYAAYKWKFRLNYRNLYAVRHEVGLESQRLRTFIIDLHKSLSISREAYVQAGQLYDAQRKLYETGVIGLQPLMDAEREKRNAISAWQQSVHELQLSFLRWQALQKGYLTSGSMSAS